jgi:hypothetical protein
VADVDESAQACFDVYAADHVYAVATAHGVVTAASPADPTKVVLGGERGAPPNRLVNQPSPVAWGREVSVCAGGVGARATSGRVVYTLHAYGTQTDYVHVLVCTFSRDAAPDCV